MSGNVNLGRTGKFGTVDFSKLKGGIKQSDFKNPEQIKLFEKLDKDSNGILTQDELQTMIDSLGDYAKDGKITQKEAKQFLKANGLKGDVKKEQVLEMLKQMGVASENIEKTKTGYNPEFNEILTTVDYKPNENGEHVWESYSNKTGLCVKRGTEAADGTYLGESFTNEGKLFRKLVVMADKTSVDIYYDEQGNVSEKETYTPGLGVTKETITYNELRDVSKQVTKTPDGWTTTIAYDENGDILRTSQKGAVTKYLDDDGKVLKEEIDKGLGGKVVTEYNYDEQGKLTTTKTTNPDGTVVVEGEQPEQEVVQQQVETQKPEKSQEYKLKVNYQDTWYGIVQAKYGITDHKATMEIVRQLKQQNNVDPKATNMPSEITLPASVTLKNGETVELKDIDAEVDKSHWGYKTTSETGRYTITQNGKTRYYAADGTELKQSYYEAKEASADKRNVSENGSGRYSYTASNGETWYFAADGTAIKKDYYEKRESEYSAVNAQKDVAKNARAAFQHQLDTDGWAGKTADAVSVLWGSDNRAVKVEADLQKYENQIKELQDAQSKGSQAFDAKFKEIFGVEYNPQNIAEYEANPTDENYKKAFGTKNDIHKRVMDYNVSQQKGASTIKTGVVIAASVGAAVATGGGSLIAEAAVIAGATATARVVTEVSDLATNNVEGDVKENIGDIAKQAVVEGVISGVTAGVIKGAGGLVGKSATTAERGLVLSSGENGAGAVVKSTASNAAKGGARAGATEGAAQGAAGAGATEGAAQGAAKGAAGAGAAEEAATAATKKFVDGISSKVAGRGLNSLNEAEISKLSKLFDVTPEQLKNLTKADFRKLVLKFHPDKLPKDATQAEREIGEQLFTILGNIFKG